MKKKNNQLAEIGFSEKYLEILDKSKHYKSFDNSFNEETTDYIVADSSNFVITNQLSNDSNKMLIK